MNKLRIERTIRIIQVVPIDEEHYPGMSPQEARDSEYAEEMENKVMQVIELVGIVDLTKPLNWGEEGTTGEFSERIVITDEERVTEGTVSELHISDK